MENKMQETAYVRMFVQDGIFHMQYKPIDLELDIAKTIVQDRVAYMEGIAYPCLFDVKNLKQSSKEARDFMANEGNDLVIASAILVNSPVLRMMANFYIMVNNPKNPSRMFNNYESALEWLNHFKPDHY